MLGEGPGLHEREFSSEGILGKALSPSNEVSWSCLPKLCGTMGSGSMGFSPGSGFPV